MTEPVSEHPRAGRRWYRRWWVWLLAGIVVVLVAGGVVFGIAWSGRGAEEASLEEAVAKFRRQAQGGESSFLRPAPGVYTYRGSGTERLSVLGTTQQWGARLPVTVTRGNNGCWTYRVEYSTNHWQDWDYCPKARTLQEIGGSTFQSFDFVAFTVDDLNVLTCDPPGEAIRVDAEPGDRWRQSCSGRSTTRDTTVISAGTNTYVGLAYVRVDDRRMPAYHYRLRRAITGTQTGTERTEVWYSARDGLPLRMDRDVRVESPSPIGAVTYTERGTFRLTAPQPER